MLYGKSSFNKVIDVVGLLHPMVMNRVEIEGKKRRNPFRFCCLKELWESLSY